MPGSTVTHQAPYYPPLVTLRYAPLAAVTSVRVLSALVDGAPVVLTAGLDYAVESTTDAIVRVTYAAGSWPRTLTPSSGWFGLPPRVEVVYTQPNLGPVPADAQLACTRTVATWFGPTLPSSALGSAGSAVVAAASGVKSYTVGQELRVEYQGPASSSSGSSASAGPLPAPIPADCALLLAPYGYATAGWAGVA